VPLGLKPDAQSSKLRRHMILLLFASHGTEIVLSMLC
jgi:hypothetical protein